MENVSSEQELLELREDGKITEDEYNQLLEAMKKSSLHSSRGNTKGKRKYLRWTISIIFLIIVAAIALSLGIFSVGTRGDIDLAISKDGFVINPYPDTELYTLTVSILNKGDGVSPSFRLKFYRGDPANNLNEKGKQQSGSYGAGPIKADDVWNERTLPFALDEGINEFYVILDTEDLVTETDETNNIVSLRVIVKDGQISEVMMLDNS
ncbi:MAG: CARDB domain-containing protein [Planctomycetota bacterium]|jgi:hypothetical protein